MTKLAIIEGNHEGLVGIKNGKIYGAAEGFAACLKSIDNELDIKIVRPHFDNHQLHDDIFSDCDGVVFTGSANYWSADDSEAAPARDVMALAFKKQKPVFGSCYGLQLAVTVLGGRNHANPVKTEFAIARDITINEAGKSHALYQGKPDIFHARCMHRDEVLDLPTGAICLSSNEHSDYQSVVFEKQGIHFWGVQYHPELQFSDIAAYIEKNDVDSFADAKNFAQELSLDVTISDVVADFRTLNKADTHLHQKYKIDETLLDDTIHQQELKNFLHFISQNAAA